MRGKNKCIILKVGFVEVGLDAATRLGSPWTMLQTTWVVWGAVWGQKGLDWTNKVGKLVETD